MAQVGSRKYLIQPDLDVIESALQRNKDNWYQLGLKLGLRKAHLDEIKDKNNNDPGECLMDMLSCWINRDDCVDAKGGPTWNTLAKALKDMGFQTAYEKILREAEERANEPQDKLLQGEKCLPTSVEAINYLKGSGFKIVRNCKALALNLSLPKDLREQYLASNGKLNLLDDYIEALECLIDHWIANSPLCSWDDFIECVKKVDPVVASQIKAKVYDGVEICNTRTSSDIEIFEYYENKVLQSLAEIQDKNLMSVITDLIKEEVLLDSAMNEAKECIWNGRSLEMFIIEKVKGAIKNNPGCFVKFVQILKAWKSCNHISVVMKIEIDEAHQSRPASNLEVPISPSFKDPVIAIQTSFEKMYCSVSQRICKKNLPLNDVKSFLQPYFGEKLRAEINQAETLECVLSIIKANSSIIHVCYIKSFVERFSVEGAASEIEEHMKEVHKFCDTLICHYINKPIQKYFIEPLRCETIKFILQWNADEKTLKDFEILLWKAFGDYVIYVKVEKIGSSNSIFVICSSPSDLMSILALKVRGNLEFLQELGVMSLTIGHNILLDHKKRDQTIQSLEETIENLKNRQVTVKEDIHLLNIEEMYKKKDLELRKLEEFLHESLYTSKDEKGKLATHLLEKNKQLQLDFDDTIINLNTTKDKLTAAEDKLTATEKIREAYKLEQERVKMLNALLLDRDEELKLKTECLNEREKLIKELQAEDDIKVHQEKLSETENKLKSMEKTLADLRKMSKAKTIQNENLRKDAELALAAIIKKDKILAELVEEKQKENEKLEKAKLEASMRIPLASRAKPEPPPIDLVMANFHKHKKTDQYWESPVFLSHNNGYEMCVRVRANGYADGRGTHLSVFLHLMKGSHDHILQWPFEGEIKLRLCNEIKESEHIDHVFKLDKSVDYKFREQVCTGIQFRGGLAANLPLYISCFISHDKLSQGFLDDDTLRFRVMEVNIATQQEVIPYTTSSSVSEASPFAVQEFVISNFTKYKKALSGFGKDWTSPPFYSHINGYKFVLIVSPNGRGLSEGRSVSAYIHLMRGENDAKLTFPFRGQIVIQLVNYLNDNHHQQVITFDDKTDPAGNRGGKVPFLYKRAYNGLGVHDFILHENLQHNAKRGTQYLDDNDCLTFRIVNINVQSV